MSYNINFDIGAMIFLTLISFLYFGSRRIRNLKDKVFSALLILGLTALVSEIISSVLDGKSTCPAPILYIVNTVFLLSEQLCLPFFFLFVILSAEKLYLLKRNIRLLIWFPFLLVIVCTAISYGTSYGIFYISEQNQYVSGFTHFILYLNVVIYFLSSIIVMAKYREDMPKKQYIYAVVFFLLVFAAIIVQSFYPSQLVVAPALALSLYTLYFVLRAPGEQIDPLTEAFSRAMLPSLLNDFHEKRVKYTLLLFVAKNHKNISSTYGNQMADKYMMAISSYLKQRFRNGTVIYMNAARFVVLSSHSDSLEDLPHSLSIESFQIPAHISAATFTHDIGEEVSNVMAAIENLFDDLYKSDGYSVLHAGNEYIRQSNYKVMLETSLSSLVGSTEPSLEMNSIYSSDKKILCIDLSLKLNVPDHTELPQYELLSILCQAGYHHWYYSTVFRLARSSCADDALLCVPITASVLEPVGISKAVAEYAYAYGLEPSGFIFRITESDIMSCSLDALRNMQLLSKRGFMFRVDDFASGQSDLSLINSLPIKFISINTDTFAGSEKLLSCICDMLLQMNDTVILAGSKKDT